MTMREILFRAKSEEEFNQGEWVYGHYHQNTIKNVLPFIVSHYIYTPDNAYEVLSDTVGQYIGEKDSCKTKIFDGDIVLHPDWKKPRLMIWNKYNLCWGFNPESVCIYYNTIKSTKIIGNIHDNPDLLNECELIY